MTHECPQCQRTASRAKGRPCAECREQQLADNKCARQPIRSGVPYGHTASRVNQAEKDWRALQRAKALTRQRNRQKAGD